jgi:L-ascorbate metabolism protein UlaG (beta-lactamase superfamily)
MKANVKRRLKRGALALLALLVLFVTGALIDGWRAFGQGAKGARLARIEKSPEFQDGHFENPQPLENDAWEMITGLVGASPHTSPNPPPRVAPIDPARFRTPPPSGLRVTWFGHASVLVEIDGRRFLTDPVWSDRASPFTWMGPSRWYPPPIAISELPAIDAVLVSHDHYDHLDHPTIVALAARGTTFVVPLGVGAHLEYWGVPLSRIVELDWWEKKAFGELEVVCTPARHASGRALWDQNSKLWASYSMVGPRHRAFFSGDTGLFPGMKEIGEKLGPFDVTLIEVGQYHRAWPDWHIGPEQAVAAHRLLRGKVMLPIHWGLFTLAYHGWTEPGERALAAAARDGTTLALPLPGQSVEPSSAPAGARWWPNLPWTTAAEHPIVSTKVN